MAITTVYTYPLNGSARDFSIPFEYLARRFVSVTLIGTDRKELSITTDFRFTSKTSIQTTKAWSQADGYELIEIRRNTSVSDRLVDFADGSILRAYELNIAQIQTMHIAEEARNLVADTIGVNNDGMLDARARRIVNVADAVEPGDTVTLRQEQAWAQSTLSNANRAQTEADRATTRATEASSSASSAGSSASAAATSSQRSFDYSQESRNYANDSWNYRDTAITKAGEASASASAAKTSETNAKTSETNAKTSETNAASWAAGVNLPSASGNGLKLLRQNATATGLEYAPHTIQNGFFDPTMGAVQLVGAFGGPKVATSRFFKVEADVEADSFDCNGYISEGLYYRIIPRACLHGPGGAGYFYLLNIVRVPGAAVQQIAIPYSPGDGAGVMSFRGLNGATWSPWVRVYDTGSVSSFIAAFMEASSPESARSAIVASMRKQRRFVRDTLWSGSASASGTTVTLTRQLQDGDAITLYHPNTAYFTGMVPVMRGLQHCQSFGAGGATVFTVSADGGSITFNSFTSGQPVGTIYAWLVED